MGTKEETKKDLKQIAVDLYDDKIFCDRQLTNQSSMPMVFLPIALGAFKNEEDVKDIGLIYEYLSEAGPRGINGYPCFFSMRILTIEETKEMFKHYEEYKKLKDSFKDSEETA